LVSGHKEGNNENVEGIADLQKEILTIKYYMDSTLKLLQQESSVPSY